jgi:SAM-dependent methyltransferase
MHKEMMWHILDSPIVHGDMQPYEYTDKTEYGLPKSYASLVFDILKNQKEKGIFLDVGGGTGELAKTIEKKSHTLSVSVDYNATGVKGKNIHAIVATATSLPFPDRSVRMVHAKDMIEHLDNGQLCLLFGEAKRVLRKGGKFVVTEVDYQLEQPWVLVAKRITKRSEAVMLGESCLDLVKRLKEKYGDSIVIDLPYFPRSEMKIIRNLTTLFDFTYEKTIEWKAKRGEPEWFRTHLPRNVMIFKK